MKVGFFGGIILLILTIVFSVIALQNNKLSRAIVIGEFNNTLDKNASKAAAELAVFDKDFMSDKEQESFDKKFENKTKEARGLK